MKDQRGLRQIVIDDLELSVTDGPTASKYFHKAVAHLRANQSRAASEAWEKAAANAVGQAAKSLRDLRVAEVVKLDLQLDAKGQIEAYRAKLNVSFKFEGS